MNRTGVTKKGRSSPEITFGDLVRTVWQKLGEMRTVLYLFVIIAVASLIGTLVPQGESPAFYAQRYGAVLSAVVRRLGLDHLYSTGWFLLLGLILILSLMKCSRRLWVQARGRWRIPDATTASKQARAAGRTMEANLDVTREEAAGLVSQTASHRGWRAWKLDASGKSHWLYLRKNRWASFGVPLTHYAVFLAALGAVLGGLPGLSVDTHINIKERETYHDSAGQLPFDVKVHDFRIENDPNTGAVENYYSDVSIVENDREILRDIISVNQPLFYRHFYLSQSSWGLADARVEVVYDDRKSELRFPLERACPGEGTSQGWVVPRSSAAAFLPGREAAFVCSGFLAAPEHGTGQAGERGRGIPAGPAVHLTMVSGFAGGDHEMNHLGWLLPGERTEIKNGTVEFLGVTEWTGLGVRKDYGVWLVWLGFIGCCVGMMMIFYFPSRWVTISLRPAGGMSTTVSIFLNSRSGESEDAAAAFWSNFLEEVTTFTATKPVGANKGGSQ